MKNAVLITVITIPVTVSTGYVHGAEYTETFDDYAPTILTRNASDAFGSWRAVLMDGRSEIGPVAAGAVVGNSTQALRFSTVATDRATAISDELSFTGGMLTINFDFVIESSTGSNTFFLANSTDNANAGAQTTLFKLTIIDQANERYRIGTGAATTEFSGTATSHTLAYGQWYRFQSIVDLNEGRFSWWIVDNDGNATRIRFDDLAFHEDTPRALESLWFGKIGAAQDLAAAIDNIAVATKAEDDSDSD